MATKQQSLTLLIDIQSAAFAEHYERGVYWSIYGDEQGKGPVPASYLVTTLAVHGARLLRAARPVYLHYLGFLLGMYHGGVLEPSTGQLCSDVTTFAHLDHRDAKRGYRAGKEFFFVEAEPHECRITEGYLLERLRESVTEMAHWKEVDSTWFFSVGCLLGELSGQLFPMDEQERKVYLPQHQRLEQARKRHTTAQKPLRSTILQEA